MLVIFFASFAVSVAAIALGLRLATNNPAAKGEEGPSVLLQDRFEDGALNRNMWVPVWWSAEERGGRLLLSSPTPTDQSRTHAALVRSQHAWRNYLLTLDMQTVRQLRHSNPNSWEVAWVWFRVQDPERLFYYLILKPTGVELGKRSLQGQVSLVTRSSPKFPIGQTNRVKIRVWRKSIKVWINRLLLIDYTDRNAIESGGIGLYEEDAHVWFDNVHVARIRP
jgi:Domain of Unknown Function (DUF1080)